MIGIGSRVRSLAAGVLLAVASPGSATPAVEKPDETAPAWMGVFLDDAVDGGVRVVALVPGGPAQEGGLRRGDVLVGVGQRTVADTSDLEQALRVRRPGERLEIRVLRAGVSLERSVALAPRPTRNEPLEGVLRLAPAPDAPGLAARDLEVVDITPELRRHFGAPEEEGVLITRVGPETTVARSGIVAGDVLIRLDERRVAGAEGARAELLGSGSRAATVVRDGRTIVVELAADDRQAEAERAARRIAAERERQVVGEIERLERRIEDLRRELERLDER